jgi:hypothetical protein
VIARHFNGSGSSLPDVRGFVGAEGLSEVPQFAHGVSVSRDGLVCVSLQKARITEMSLSAMTIIVSRA